MIGVRDRIVHGLLRLLVQRDAPVRELERRVIAGCERQHEERLADCVQGLEVLVRLVEEILVRSAPLPTNFGAAKSACMGRRRAPQWP
jgi:hypothetical protein